MEEERGHCCGRPGMTSYRRDGEAAHSCGGRGQRDAAATNGVRWFAARGESKRPMRKE